VLVPKGVVSAVTTPSACGTTIALTGGTGFIGRRLLDALVAGGHRVRALVRRSQPPRAGVEWVAGDIANTTALAHLFAGAGTCIHLAGVVRGVRQSDFDAVNVAGSERVGAAATRTGVERLLLVSSLAARAPEISYYAASKRAGEDAMRRAFPAVTILRPPAVYGPGDDELRPLLDGMARGLGVHPGHGGRFSLIYVDDLVGAIEAWLRTPSIDRGFYEVDDGAPDGYDWPAVLRAVAAVAGRRVVDLPVPRVVLGVAAAVNAGIARLLGRAPMLTPGKVRELYHADWVCRDRRLAESTGWQPHFPLEMGLRATFSSAR
jgi:nucleoside-diphosphate-sugar epimerase